MRLTPEEALKTLAEQRGRISVELFRHGSLVLKVYAPIGADLQTPHSRDEVYVVISGNGVFVNGATRKAFKSGDVLFVAAGAEHRFEEFTGDFATWVIFYGPEGGEANPS